MPETHALQLLRVFGERVAGKTGEEFFRHTVREIAQALGATYAFASRFNHAEHSAKVLAYWVEDHYEPFADYMLAGTPCELVSDGNIAVFRDNLIEQFPLDRDWFEQLGVKSYLAIPVRTDDGNVCGHLAVMAKEDRDWQEADVDILRLFSLRAAGELERGAWEERLQHSNHALAQANDQLRLEILERFRVEADLAAAKVAAESASQAKSAFLANMSHELRTPLNGILGYVQLLLREPAVSAAQTEALEVIRLSGQHLHELINEVLDLTKIEAGKTVLHPTVTALVDHLGYVADIASIRAREAGLTFSYERAPQLPAAALLDAKAFRQVLINLVGNAIKFTPSGGSVTMRVGGEMLEGGQFRLNLEVEDTGVGIPASELEKVFQPFHRVETPGRMVEGTGLGLAISQRIVVQMGGRLTVRSRLNEGSCFRLDLAVECADSRTQIAPTPNVIIGYSGRRQRILIADDDAVSRDLLAKFLGSLGFVCVLAVDGADAIDALTQSEFNLIMTDLDMPRVDGRGVLAAARKRGLNVPILAVSASTAMGDRDRAMHDGFSEFLGKPWEIDHLLQSVGATLGITWLRRVDAVPTPAFAKPAPRGGAHLESNLVQSLYHFAKAGDVNAMTDALNAAHGPGDSPLADEIRRLMKEYDLRAVRNILEPLVVDAEI